MLKNKKVRPLRAISLLLLVAFFLAFFSSCQYKEVKIRKPPSNRHQSFNFLARKGMVVAAHPLAAQAGLEMLKEGGNAVDAAITASFALNVCEPFASGIGGGGFMVIYLASEKRITIINFREKAPSKTFAEILKEKEETKNFGLAVAVPGALAGWSYALRKYGTRNLADVMEGAIEMAEKGFTVSQTLSLINKDEFEKLILNAGEKTCYLNQGLPYEPGDLFENPELASTFRLICSKGIDEFYQDEIAKKIVKAVKDKGGVMTLEDLAAYEPIEQTPLEGSYKDYRVFTVPPPGSGGIHLIQLLNIIENWPIKKWGHNSTPYIHHFCEALRFIFSDREHYLGDPDFVDIPIARIISKEYAAEVASKIKPDRLLDDYPFGEFEEKAQKKESTTHLCVIDQEGNIVSQTQSINDFFGSGIVPEGTGILLNNHMDDFSSAPCSPNAPRPLQRPVSSMGPLIIFKKEEPFLVLGSPGGTRIFSSLTQIIINIIEFGMSLDEAIEAPRFFSFSEQGKAGSISLESRFPAQTLETLKRIGHEVTIKEAFDKYFGGAQGIMIIPRKKLILGGADSRRDGYGAGY